MRRINPTIRGLAIVFLAAGVVTALQLEDVLGALFLVIRIAFLLAITYFVFTLWRRNREEIATWSGRSQVVMYGGAALAIVNIGAAFVTSYPQTGGEAVLFFIVLAACGFAIWRVWRDEHSYG